MTSFGSHNYQFDSAYSDSTT